MPSFNSNQHTWRDLDSMLNGVLQRARKTEWTADNVVDAAGGLTLTVVLTPRAEPPASQPMIQERTDGTATKKKGTNG